MRRMVDDDVNIMALGEHHAGLAKQVDDFLFVKIGTGIGCGIFVEGRVHRGVTGSAGDIGHIAVEDDGPTCACGNTPQRARPAGMMRTSGRTWA